MNEMLAPALELDAEAVAASPLLGYRIVEVAWPDEDSAAETLRQLRLYQPWIETENIPVTIDIDKFRERRPLADLLADGSEVSEFVTSVSQALADFRDRWAISPQLYDRADSSASKGLAISICGEDVKALVWREGMVIGAQEPFATALKLLVTSFSKAARRTYVYSNPQLLTNALALLPGAVKSQYVPGADSFIDQAKHERDTKSHELAAKRQKALREKHRKIEIKPGPESGQ